MHPSSNESMDDFWSTYIPDIYCLLGGYKIPTTLYKEQNNPLNEDLIFFDEMKVMKPQTGASSAFFAPWKWVSFAEKIEFLSHKHSVV